MASETISNAARSAATRALLLETAVKAIVQYGYAGATSTRISELSGLTRGAQIHHFGPKSQLMVEALLHLHEQRLAALAGASGDPLGSTSVDEWVRSVWGTFNDDVWIAAAELWTAARTDPELREALVPAERVIGDRILARSATLPFFADVPRDRIGSIVGLAMSALRGLRMQNLLDAKHSRVTRQLDELSRGIEVLIADAREQRAG